MSMCWLVEYIKKIHIKKKFFTSTTTDTGKEVKSTSLWKTFMHRTRFKRLRMYRRWLPKYRAFTEILKI